jgi:hypothetical protein
LNVALLGKFQRGNSHLVAAGALAALAFSVVRRYVSDCAECASNVNSGGLPRHDRPVIARRGVGLYSFVVRTFFWQRWALIFVLVSRLVIGELGHAMPMADSMAMSAAHHHQMAAESSTATDPVACGEHESGSQIPASHHAGDAAVDSSGEQDCCQTGECECPCLHVPCAALDAHVLSPVATTLLRTPQRAEGLVTQRPSGLFRPPA